LNRALPVIVCKGKRVTVRLPEIVPLGRYRHYEIYCPDARQLLGGKVLSVMKRARAVNRARAAENECGEYNREKLSAHYNTSSSSEENFISLATSQINLWQRCRPAGAILVGLAAGSTGQACRKESNRQFDIIQYRRGC
jgi:hypothetical protein